MDKWVKKKKKKTPNKQNKTETIGIYKLWIFKLATAQMVITGQLGDIFVQYIVPVLHLCQWLCFLFSYCSGEHWLTLIYAEE